MDNETDFCVIDEAQGKVLFFANEGQLVSYVTFSEGTPVFMRDITPDDLNRA